MKVSVVLVHYHTPELAARAVAALRRGAGPGPAGQAAEPDRDADARPGPPAGAPPRNPDRTPRPDRDAEAGPVAGTPATDGERTLRQDLELDAASPAGAPRVPGGSQELEILVVDNGSDPAGRDRLAGLDARLLEPGENLGYAGGLNLGVAESSGEVLLLANPDVELMPGALGRLVTTLGEHADPSGAAVVGPRFLWDPGGRLLLPPAERRDRGSELLAALAARGPGWAARARRRWRRHARRHWTATEAHPSPWLSGALLATTRAAWDRVGPFDAGYHLYFEETDWLLRAVRRGVPILHEPRARAIHHYNRSAAAEPRAAAWFAASEGRFTRRWYGPAFRALRRWAAPREERISLPPPSDRLLVPAAGPPELDLAGLASTPGAGNLWLELSPLARGFPAAAERLDRAAERWRLPLPLWSGMDAGRWCLTLVDDAGRERLRTGLEVPPPEVRG